MRGEHQSPVQTWGLVLEMMQRCFTRQGMPCSSHAVCRRCRLLCCLMCLLATGMQCLPACPSRTSCCDACPLFVLLPLLSMMQLWLLLPQALLPKHHAGRLLLVVGFSPHR